MMTPTTLVVFVVVRQRLRNPEVLTWIARYESGIVPLPCSAYLSYGLF